MFGNILGFYTFAGGIDVETGILFWVQQCGQENKWDVFTPYPLDITECKKWD